MSEGLDNYQDIINLSHPVSKKHPPLPMSSRAAQFSPFAAVVGHDEAIRKQMQKHEYAVEHPYDEDYFYQESIIEQRLKEE